MQTSNKIDKETNLHLFDNQSFGIQNWCTSTIKNLDLNHIKLIGLSKKVQIQKSIQPYVSIFDFEQKTFIGPKYNGKILNSIFERKFLDEEIYLSKIFFIFSELMIKVTLFHNESLFFIRDNHEEKFNKLGVINDSKFFLSTNEQNFKLLHRLNILNSDIDIVIVKT